jgi:hypothetical protein
MVANQGGSGRNCRGCQRYRWRQEGLKVPTKQPKKGRLWLNDGSCIRLRPAYRDHVWSYDFVHHRTDDRRAFRILNVLDEYGRECSAIRVARKLNPTDVNDHYHSNRTTQRGRPEENPPKRV